MQGKVLATLRPLLVELVKMSLFSSIMNITQLLFGRQELFFSASRVTNFATLQILCPHILKNSRNADDSAN